MSSLISFLQFSSVQSLSCVQLFATPHESQHTKPPCPSPTPRVHSDSRPSSQWCHPAISSFVVPFSSCPQSLPASESFPMSQLFTWGGQSTGVSALASVLPKKSQGWSPSEWTGWISLQSKGLSRVFSNTTVQKHQFLCQGFSIRNPILQPQGTMGSVWSHFGLHLCLWVPCSVPQISQSIPGPVLHSLNFYLLVRHLDLWWDKSSHLIHHFQAHLCYSLPFVLPKLKNVNVRISMSCSLKTHLR